jgi:hypothetical protein
LDRRLLDPSVGLDVSEEIDLLPLQGFEATFVQPAAWSL